MFGFFVLTINCFALNDPTRPLTFSGYKSYSTRGVTVFLIVVGKNRSLANVNGVLVKVGDEIDGLKVTAINKDAVSFKGKEEEFKVMLHHPVAVRKSKVVTNNI